MNNLQDDPFAQWIPKTESAVSENTSSQDPFSQWIPKTENVSQPSAKTKEDFSWWNLNFSREGQKAQADRNRNNLKAFLEGSTAGGSSYFDSLKPDYDQPESSISHGLGTLLPVGMGLKIANMGFKFLGNIFKFGPNYALELGQTALGGLLYGTAKEGVKAVKGEGFDVSAPVKEGLEFAGGHHILKGLIYASPPAAKWIKSLNKNQQAKILVDGIIPDNLTANQYKFWETEVAPEWLETSKSNYEKLTQEATESANKSYQQKINNVRAEHEKELYEASQEGTLSKQNIQNDQEKYQNKLRQVAAEHEQELTEIQKQNAQAVKEYEEAVANFEQLKARERAVEQATQLSPQEREVPYREARPNEVNPSLENSVGNVISPNEATNTTNMGRSVVEAVRANDAIDYHHVNELYKISRELNEGVEVIQPNMVMDLRRIKNDLLKIPQPSPPQEQMLKIVDKILEDTVVLGEEGTIIGFKPINNNVLEEQAKAVRHFMDFNFEHGNSRGILTPLVNIIEDAIFMGANMTGHTAAAEANQAARSAYRSWAQAYDNAYIRPYRDVNNFDYSKLYRSSLDVDEFNMVNNILQRSNAGQQLAGATKRSLVEKKLGKFLENPHVANGKEFQTALNELAPVISEQETAQIRNLFNEERQRPPFIFKLPSPPKIKEVPTEVKIPLKGEIQGNKKGVSQVKIPLKEFKETPQMKLAAQEMNMKPEQIRKLADTPSGLKKLKENTSKSVYEKIVQQRTQEIIFEGNVKHKITGDRLAKTLNTGNNYELLSEMHGEEVAADVLQASQKIANQTINTETLKQHLKHYAVVKLFLKFGIL